MQEENDMRHFLGAVFIFLATSPVAECFCGDGANSFVYLTESKFDYEYMEELPWRFLYAECHHQTGETLVFVELVGEGDEALEKADVKTLFSSIHWKGRWISFLEFEAWLQPKMGCTAAIS